MQHGKQTATTQKETRRRGCYSGAQPCRDRSYEPDAVKQGARADSEQKR